jgi:hypothetical protein
MSFRWYYPDQVRPVFLRTTACCGTPSAEPPPYLDGEGSGQGGTTAMLPNTRLLH